MLEFLPQTMFDVIKPYIGNGLQEIRLRANKPCLVNVDGKYFKLERIPVTCGTIEKIVLSLTKHSLYAYEKTISEGYLSGECGERIGIAGECVYDEKLKFIKNITSLCIRIPSQIIGCSERIAEKIFEKSFENLLIISPPGGGKTTYLRDFCRILSNKYKKNVLLIDEKNEISGKNFDIGERTDVFLLAKKAFGIKKGILNMRPDYIIVDELSAEEEIEAVTEACFSGVKIIASAHGSCVEDIKNKHIFSSVFQNNVFGYVLILSDSNGAGTIEGLTELC